jgi:hypothetical protein
MSSAPNMGSSWEKWWVNHQQIGNLIGFDGISPDLTEFDGNQWLLHPLSIW